MRIVPAIDILDGKCVRLTQGDFKKVSIYNDDPVTVALEFQNLGLKYLHLVDLEGARAGKVVNWNVIRKLKEGTDLVIDFGGGAYSDEDVEQLLELGISRINIGSLAVKDSTKLIAWFKKFGAEIFILSADVSNEKVMINGWKDSASINLFDLVDEYLQHGLKYLTCTDIASDGMLMGPNFNLYEKLKSRFPTVDITASGGIASTVDLRKLKSLSMDGAIIGKALYERKIAITDLLTI
jgi:phosphoribosylformimino-5-aminoimidazole carboxamide ribotide isomerase